MKVPSIRAGFAVPRYRWLGAAALAVVVIVPAVASTQGGAAPAEDKANGAMVVTWRAPSSTARIATPEVVSGPTQKNLEFVALSQACRFYDTRIAGVTAFTPNQSRDITVLDGGFPGSLGPCGVPTRAKAVDLSLSTLAGTPTAAGFTRIGPGGAAPSATVLQFGKGQGVSATTTSGLSADGKVRITSNGAGAGYVADLIGFWQEPIEGLVNADGTLLVGTGITLIEKSPTFLGDYIVTFDRPLIPNCAVVAIGDSSTTRFFSYALSNTSQWYFDARVYNSTAEVDSSFSFVVQC